MEHFKFDFQASGNRDAGRPDVLVGVVSSGNLEVLIEPADLNGCCQILVSTSARGFADIWQAVLNDFTDRHELANLRISVNDGGASPAVVSLRLDQAVDEYRGGLHE